MTRPSFQLSMDGMPVEARDGETLLAVAGRLGIEIPVLCHLAGVEKLESCGVCMVEVEGHSSLLPACAARAQAGMVVHTGSPVVLEARQLALELLLSDHVGDCSAPCELACPAQIDIPGFLRMISARRPADALAVMKRSTAFPGVLGRICPGFCELVCRRGQLDEPVAICALKRGPADADARADRPWLPDLPPPSGKRVAIVGGGVVGLSAAFFLLQRGHACTVFEAAERPGGVIRHVIPRFRLPREVVDDEVQRIVDMGCVIQCGQSLGADISLADLTRDFDAVLMATGATGEVLPHFPGSETAESALAMLAAVGGGDEPELSGEALVVGQGPIALDAARTLVRLGARVSLLLPTTRAASLLLRGRFEAAESEGVVLIENAGPRELVQGEDASFLLRYLREGRPLEARADRVFLVGQLEIDRELLSREGLALGPQGVVVDRASLATNLPGVFAAGNVVRSAARFAAHASAAGRRAAASIARFLEDGGSSRPNAINVRMGALSEADRALLFAGRPPTSRVATHGHSAPRDFEEVDAGFTETEARTEAGRCLDCDCAAKHDCGLRALSSEYDAQPNAIGGERPLFERDCTHPAVVYESGKCIKCGRCIAIARSHGEALGLAFIGRGFQVRVGVPLDRSLAEGLTSAAAECAQACPTGALALRRERGPLEGE